MKPDDYIKQLEDLKSKYGNVDVKVNKTFECMDLSINDTYSDPEEPYFDYEQMNALLCIANIKVLNKETYMISEGWNG